MALPRLGGDVLLRGYNGSRFRDKILAAAQVEYRAPLIWRIGIVGFAGLGQVADRFEHLGRRGLKPSLGFGLRFNLDPPDGLNLRLDFGFGRKSDGNYLSGGESF
jgi:outer membrane translocation and assembly module TamA